MMNVTKVRLSEEEEELVRNAEIILTKNAVMKKMQYLLEELQELHHLFLHDKEFIPAEVRHNSPKISRGENYLGLPYLVLDQPRFFEINNIFAVRTLFWWGRYFILTLHVSGRYKETFESQLFNAINSAPQHYYFCIHEEQWVHHLEPGNYTEIRSENLAELQSINASRPFLKIARKIEFGNINEATTYLQRAYEEMLDLLNPTLKPLHS
jgi:ribosomal protein L32E